MTDVAFSECFSCHTAVSHVHNLTFAVVSFWNFLHYLRGQVARLRTFEAALYKFAHYITTTSSDTVREDFKNCSFYARKLEKQGIACTLATRLFDHSPNSNRPCGLSDRATAARL